MTQRMKIAYIDLPLSEVYYSNQITYYTLSRDYVPLITFNIFAGDINLDETKRNAVKTLLEVADEIWIFRDISHRNLAGIKRAKELGKTVRYFRLKKSQDIIEISNLEEVVMDEDIAMHRNEL